MGRFKTSFSLTFSTALIAFLALTMAPVAVPAATTTTTITTDIVSASSGQCASVSGGSLTSGTAVVQTPCGGVAGQDWSLVAVGSYYHIVSSTSGQCLNVSGGSTTEGAAIIQWPCQAASSNNDQWSYAAFGSYYHLINARSGMCLNVEYNSQNSGAALIQWPCQTTASADSNDQWSLDVPSLSVQPSLWTGVIDLPVTPIAIANLPDGTLLMWSAYEQYSYEGDIGNAAGQTWTAIFNPSTMTSSSSVLVTNTGADMFCPGTAVLFDGRVLVNGGSSSPKTSIYQYKSGGYGTWSISGDMNIPRGYEADTLLSNGNVFTLGGSWSGGDGGKVGEIWNSSSGTNGSWTEESGIPETNIVGPDPQGIYRGDNHLWMFAQSNGTVFQAGPSSQMNWINTTPTGGTIQSAGYRSATPASAVGADPYSINGNAVLYDVGKILKVGGAPAYQQSTGTTYATNSAYLIDITEGFPKTPTVTKLTPMSYERAFSNSVVLPNGQVVVIGGQSIPQPFTDDSAILVPEIWTPSTQKFQLLNPMQTPRTYHSTALLLADGRVFVGGGGQCGTGCAQNHLTAEILTPPYLLTSSSAADVRPGTPVTAPTVTLGGTLTVATQAASSTVAATSSFALMRLSATTHTVNNDQRRIPFSTTLANAVQTSPTSWQLTIPSDPGVVLPGYYMLFALTASGVPSVSTTVQVLP
jgi:galactose oxidase